MKRIFAIPILILASFVMFLYVVLPQISAAAKAREDFLKTEKEANNNGLVLKTLAPAIAPVIDDGKVEKNPVHYFMLALSGSMPSFESFVKDIETSARLVDVESISLQQGLGEA